MNLEWIREPIQREERRKELSGGKGGHGELPKERGLSTVKRDEEEPAEISGTGAKTRQNRDQRDQPNEEERVQGDRKGEAASARTKGSKAGDQESKANYRGSMDQEPEAMETLPEANQRGDCVVSG